MLTSEGLLSEARQMVNSDLITMEQITGRQFIEMQLIYMSQI